MIRDDLIEAVSAWLEEQCHPSRRSQFSRESVALGLRNMQHRPKRLVRTVHHSPNENGTWTLAMAMIMPHHSMGWIAFGYVGGDPSPVFAFPPKARMDAMTSDPRILFPWCEQCGKHHLRDELHVSAK